MGCILSLFSKQRATLPIETSFSLPSPLPSWPSGGGFAKGSISLGDELELRQVSTFTKVWTTHEGGQDNLGATFFTPSPIPNGFSMLGCYAQPNNKPLFGWVLVGRDTADGTAAALAKPVDYTLVWSSESSSVKQDGHGYFWLPTPPDGYKAVGVIVTAAPEKPSLDEIRCIRADLTDESETDTSIWSSDKDGFSVNGIRPTTRGIQALGVLVGTFIPQANNSPIISTLPCLKNTSSNFTTSMPNLTQIDALFQSYSPYIYFHPDEPFLLSSLAWFFGNGALLYQKGSQNPTKIAADGSNLPLGGSNDGQYWMDLPVDGDEKEKVKRGDLSTAKVYLHIKPMLGGTFTDIAVWVFYPFNGPARAKVVVTNISLGRIGEHVGDWEHITLRISNFNGELWKVYFSEHSSGKWVDASEVEFGMGNKPVTYASLHGHAFYAKEGLVLQGNTKLGIGIRNDTKKGSKIDTGERFEVAAAEYLGAAVVGGEPAWLDYQREWGPKISYDIGEELKKVERFLPKSIRKELEKLIAGLPDEVLGEEGPTGPKGKSNWNMDEK